MELTDFYADDFTRVLVFSQNIWAWGLRGIVHYWLLVIVVDFLKECMFFYFRKKFQKTY